MEEKFVIKSEFDLKKRIDIIRIFMGKTYYMFLLIAAAVVCFNYYLISSGRAAQNDARKTVILFVLMIIWAFIPVVAGFVWNSISKVKEQTITIFADRVVAVTDSGSFELLPDRFYMITEVENYIKLGPLKQQIIINLNDVKAGNADDIARFLRDME